MRRIFPLLLLLALLLCPAARGESPLPTPAPPVPVRSHTEQFATPEPPPVVNAAADPDAASSVRFLLDAKLLHVWFPNIVNADEAILIYGDEVWLLDCGDVVAAERGVTLMKQLGITKIDMIVNSHPHHDHLGGLRCTAEAFPVGQLLICYPENVNATMKNAMKWAEHFSIPVESYSDGDVLAMGDGKVSLTFMLPAGQGLDMNNTSAQTMVRFGNRSILFTADIKTDGEAAVLAQYPPEAFRADVLKVPHHGKDILLGSFLEAVSPSLAVVTNKAADWIGMKHLKNHKIPILYTVAGKSYVHLYTDGNAWIAEYVPLDFSLE